MGNWGCRPVGCRTYCVDVVTCLPAPASGKNLMIHCWDCCWQMGLQLLGPLWFASAAEISFPPSLYSVIDYCRSVKAWPSQPNQDKSEGPFHLHLHSSKRVGWGCHCLTCIRARLLPLSSPFSPLFPKCGTQGHTLINMLCTRLCLRVNLLGNSIYNKYPSGVK